MKKRGENSLFYMELDSGEKLEIVPPELVTTVSLGYSLDYELALTDEEGKEATEKEKESFFKKSLQSAGIDAGMIFTKEGEVFIFGHQIYRGFSAPWGGRALSQTEMERYIEVLKAIQEDYKARLIAESQKEGMKIVVRKTPSNPIWNQLFPSNSHS